jgi:hypothetical protein
LIRLQYQNQKCKLQVFYSHIRARGHWPLLQLFTVYLCNNQHWVTYQANRPSTSTPSKSREIQDRAERQSFGSPHVPVHMRAAVPRRELGVAVGHGRAPQELAFLGNGSVSAGPLSRARPAACGPLHAAPRRSAGRHAWGNPNPSCKHRCCKSYGDVDTPTQVRETCTGAMCVYALVCPWHICMNSDMLLSLTVSIQTSYRPLRPICLTESCIDRESTVLD